MSRDQLDKNSFKILFILFLLLFINGCAKESSHIDWQIEEKNYSQETIELNEPENILIVSRIHNTETDEKFVQFTCYLYRYDAVGLLFPLSIDKDISELRLEMDYFLKEIIEIQEDDFYEQSLQDLLLPSFRYRKSLLKEQVSLTDGVFQKGKQAIKITFCNQEIIFEEWDGEKYVVENGKKDNINIESNVYHGILKLGV